MVLMLVLMLMLTLLRPVIEWLAVTTDTKNKRAHVYVYTPTHFFFLYTVHTTNLELQNTTHVRKTQVAFSPPLEEPLSTDAGAVLGNGRITIVNTAPSLPTVAAPSTDPSSGAAALPPSFVTGAIDPGAVAGRVAAVAAAVAVAAAAGRKSITTSACTPPTVSS